MSIAQLYPQKLQFWQISLWSTSDWLVKYLHTVSKQFWAFVTKCGQLWSSCNRVVPTIYIKQPWQVPAQWCNCSQGFLWNKKMGWQSFIVISLLFYWDFITLWLEMISVLFYLFVARNDTITVSLQPGKVLLWSCYCFISLWLGMISLLFYCSLTKSHCCLFGSDGIRLK